MNDYNTALEGHVERCIAVLGARTDVLQKKRIPMFVEDLVEGGLVS